MWCGHNNYVSSPPLAVDFLQCSAEIISKVGSMRPVSCEILYTIQDVVNKSLEATW